MSKDHNIAAVRSGDSVIEAQRAKAGFWFTEDVAPGLRIEMSLNRILHSTESQFQKIDVIETYFGKTLITDGKTQSAQFDEFVYHESLVHPSLLKSALLAGGTPPRSVFVGGGGELATAREVLRHKSVERVVMVDLDAKVIEVCKRYLPEWGGEEVATDPRLELIVGDAHAYLLQTQETFDVIIMDISDPIEAGPGIMLYTKEFYKHALTRLNAPHGVFVTQAGTADSVPPAHAFQGVEGTSCFGPIYNTLGTVFDCVVPYSTNIPSFGSDWGFVMAFNAPPAEKVTVGAEGMVQDWCAASSSLIEDLISTRTAEKQETVGAEGLVQDWCAVSSSLIDRLISMRIKSSGKGRSGKEADGNDVLRHYDGTTHRTMFALTKPLRTSLKADTRIMTRDNPIFMY